ncbi:hypothetical protein CFP56_012185 [Quercus suber]|uniref:Uncharacterized protein n=1 Tax=Quercus suber TaxID=58331 RepID=A0AAW0KZ05_QUESU
MDSGQKKGEKLGCLTVNYREYKGSQEKRCIRLYLTSFELKYDLGRGGGESMMLLPVTDSADNNVKITLLYSDISCGIKVVVV